MIEPLCHRCGLPGEDFAGLSPSGYHTPEDCLWLVMQENKRLRAENERLEERVLELSVNWPVDHECPD